MIDPRTLRERPGDVREMLSRRGVEYDLDALVGADAEWRRAASAADAARQRRNELGRAVAAAKKSGADASAHIAEMRGAADRLDALEAARREAHGRYAALAMSLPNMVHESVPTGPDSGANVVVREWGEARPADGDHAQVLERMGLVDIERAAKVSGARFYYLVGDMVLLGRALVSHALDLAAERGYTAIQPPYMIRRDAMEGATVAEDLEEAIYGVEGEDLCMIGTSEHAMAAMHSDEILEGASLPVRYAGYSACFRKEAGAHGRDQKGIFRVHQFDKVEQFAFARPEESWAEHERMLGVAEEFYRGLGLPHRVVLLSSGDMGKVSAKTYDIEAWMASQREYREAVSCSNCLDYQARRLRIRFRDKTSEATRHVHTLNSTLVATTRALVAIVEGCRASDGRIEVPRPLQRYVGKADIGGGGAAGARLPR
ncbi:MAG: serine--tRNA ligase, partial [Thaumarchaeota archaeon S14]